MARRAAELFKRMPADQVGIGMAAEWSVGALGEAEVAFCDCQKGRNILRSGANMAGVAAGKQSSAAKLIDSGAGRIDIDLNNFLIEVAHAVEQPFERCGTQTGKMFGSILRDGIASGFGGLVNFAPLGNERGPFGHDAREGVIELVARE